MSGTIKFKKNIKYNNVSKRKIVFHDDILFSVKCAAQLRKYWVIRMLVFSLL